MSPKVISSDLILGIDEAGRGPVLGPLVLCGVAATPAQREFLNSLDLRDSKRYGSNPRGRQRRARLAEKIRDTATVAVEVAEAEAIDAWSLHGNLNELERDLARRIIETLGRPSAIVADGQRLFAPLRDLYPHLEARDRADATEVLVSAASIVAKVERDRRVEALFADEASGLGPVAGGGYPNAATERFLRAYVAKHAHLPREVRQSFAWPVLIDLRQNLGLIAQDAERETL